MSTGKGYSVGFDRRFTHEKEVSLTSEIACPAKPFGETVAGTPVDRPSSARVTAT